jgi:hypothetical protein
MTPRTLAKLCTGVGATWLLCLTFVTHAGQPDPSKPKQVDAEKKQIDAKYRVPVAMARDRATLMHEIYESTLHSMHRHYFRRERATLPARALEDVFSEMEGQSKVDARWIAVNTKAMSINHEPETEFEKQAAKEIASGKSDVELIEKGVYHRATAIPLGAGCVSCHNGLLAPPKDIPRFAGLVISIPVKDD